LLFYYCNHSQRCINQICVSKMSVGLIFGHPNVFWQNVCQSNVCQPYGYRLNVCQPNVYLPNGNNSCVIKHCLSQMYFDQMILYPMSFGQMVLYPMSFGQKVLYPMYFGQMTKSKLCQPNFVLAKCQQILCQGNVGRSNICRPTK
jgi:hypothetical protein